MCIDPQAQAVGERLELRGIILRRHWLCVEAPLELMKKTWPCRAFSIGSKAFVRA
jgi:hypothetical protein